MNNLFAIALGCLCLWFLVTWEVRVAYLELAGQSHLWTISTVNPCVLIRMANALVGLIGSDVDEIVVARKTSGGCTVDA